MTEKGDQLDSEQLIQISRNIGDECSDVSIAFYLHLESNTWFSFFRKEDLCHLWCSFLKPICGWQHLENVYLLKMIRLAHSKNWLSVSSVTFRS